MASNRLDTSRQLRVVDSHTCGQPTRVIIQGTGIADGTDPVVARAELRDQRDWIRRIAVMEPRGHLSMFAVALIPPTTTGGDYGVVFMDAHGYPDMCGHATIGVATTLLEEGFITPADPGHSGLRELGLLTPSGRITLRAHLENGKVKSVAFRAHGVFYLGSMTVRLGDVIKSVELGYGGQWYAFMDLAHTGLRVEAQYIGELVRMAAAARAEIQSNLHLLDPKTGAPPHPINIVWTDTPRHPAAAARNVPISPAGSFDRSPCGTATCARMAVLVAQGKLPVGGQFMNEGLMGTLYRGTPISAVSHFGLPGIVAEVEGSAWITARATLTVDPRDPLGEGYLAVEN